MIRRKLNWQKTTLFFFFMSLLTIFVLEGVSRTYEYWQASQTTVENQFIRTKNVVPVFRRGEEDDNSFYVRTKHHWIPDWPRFRVHKTPDIYRIFCLGGSAAMGWPHSGEESYPWFLQEELKKILPQKKIEVLNVAGNSYASYRVKIVFDEIINYDPDLIIIYSGNNEFLESLVYNINSPQAGESFTLWKHLALARVLRGSVTAISSSKPAIPMVWGAKTMTTSRLSFAFGYPSRLRSDPEQFRTVVEHYRYNIKSIVQTARKRGVDLLLLNVPSNLKDWRPNVSEHWNDITNEDLARWQEFFRKGVQALERQRFTEAVSALREAASIDPDYAEVWFYLGRAHYRLGRYVEAKEAFLKAKEMDARPFRALFNKDLVEIASRFEVPIVDLVTALERETEDGILGFNVMVDYVHPTVASNEVIALEVLKTLVEQNMLPAPPALSLAEVRQTVSPDAEEKIMTLRGLFKQFMVMRQYESLEEIAVRLRNAINKVLPRASSKRQKNYQKILARLDHTMETLRPYQRLLRAEKLGIIAEEFSPGEAEAIFEDYVELIHGLEARSISSLEFKTFIPEKSYGKK